MFSKLAMGFRILPRHEDNCNANSATSESPVMEVLMRVSAEELIEEGKRGLQAKQ